MTVKLKHIYIFFLLIIVSLLVFIVHNISQQGTTSTKEIEFNRVDGYNELLGNITQISVTVYNKDTVNHNYTISSFVNSNIFSSDTVEVSTDMPYTYSITIPIEKKYNADNVLIDDPTHNINLTVYRDDSDGPLDQIEFKYN
jgi:hypothetical protein